MRMETQAVASDMTVATRGTYACMKFRVDAAWPILDQILPARADLVLRRVDPISPGHLLNRAIYPLIPKFTRRRERIRLRSAVLVHYDTRYRPSLLDPATRDRHTTDRVRSPRAQADGKMSGSGKGTYRSCADWKGRI
jgi:hypothetical protein